MFWENLSPDGGGKPEGDLAAAIDEGFGTFEGLKNQLTESALNVQGSGWGALTWEPLGQRLIVEQVYDHQSNVGQGAPPLLVLDMWEHAYYLQYKNVKADWVKAFWEIVNWPDVVVALRARPHAQARSSRRASAAAHRREDGDLVAVLQRGRVTVRRLVAVDPDARRRRAPRRTPRRSSTRASSSSSPSVVGVARRPSARARRLARAGEQPEPDGQAERPRRDRP